MLDYMTNEGKPERLLLGYVTLRGPDLEQVYRYLESNSPCEVSQIVDDLFVGSDSEGSNHPEECLRFLQTVDMVRKTDEGYVIMNEEVSEDTSFGLKLLRHLKEQGGKQSSLTYILELIAREDLSTTTQSDLIATIERDDNGYDFSWTDPKIKQWSYLMDYIGVIRMETENELIFYPKRDLVLELLINHHNQTEEDNLTSLVEYIEKNYWNCMTQSTQPTIYEGLSATLLNMHRSGIIQLQSYSDGDEVRIQKPENEGYENYTNYSIKTKDASDIREVA